MLYLSHQSHRNIGRMVVTGPRGGGKGALMGMEFQIPR